MGPLWVWDIILLEPAVLSRQTFLYRKTWGKHIDQNTWVEMEKLVYTDKMQCSFLQSFFLLIHSGGPGEACGDGFDHRPHRNCDQGQFFYLTQPGPAAAGEGDGSCRHSPKEKARTSATTPTDEGKGGAVNHLWFHQRHHDLLLRPQGVKDGGATQHQAPAASGEQGSTQQASSHPGL